MLSAQQTDALTQPSLSANASIAEAKQSYQYIIPASAVPHGWNDIGQGTLDFNWEIDFWGKNRAALAAAQKEAVATAAEAAATRLILSTSIAATYGELARYYAELDAAQDAVTVRQHSKDLIDERFSRGLENAGAVDRASSSLAMAHAEISRLNEGIELTRHRLAELTGEGPDRGNSILRPGPFVHKSFGLPSHLPMNLIGRRPDIIAAKLRTEAASSRIDVAHASFYPNVNLTAFIGVQALGLDALTKPGADFGSVGPAFSLPIFDGGRLRAQYHSTEADYQLAVAQYDGTVLQAFREVADAATSERQLVLRLEDSRKAERSAGAAWQVASNRYKGGLANYLEVLTAEDALISSQRVVADLETRSFSIDVSLIRALGGGFESRQENS